MRITARSLDMGQLRHSLKKALGYKPRLALPDSAGACAASGIIVARDWGGVRPRGPLLPRSHTSRPCLGPGPGAPLAFNRAHDIMPRAPLGTARGGRQAEAPRDESEPSHAADSGGDLVGRRRRWTRGVEVRMYVELVRLKRTADCCLVMPELRPRPGEHHHPPRLSSSPLRPPLPPYPTHPLTRPPACGGSPRHRAG